MPSTTESLNPPPYGKAVRQNTGATKSHDKAVRQNTGATKSYDEAVRQNTGATKSHDKAVRQNTGAPKPPGAFECCYCYKAFKSRRKLMDHVFSDVCRYNQPSQPPSQLSRQPPSSPSGPARFSQPVYYSSSSSESEPPPQPTVPRVSSPAQARSRSPSLRSSTSVRSREEFDNQGGYDEDGYDRDDYGEESYDQDYSDGGYFDEDDYYYSDGGYFSDEY